MASKMFRIFSRNVTVCRSLQDSLREPLSVKAPTEAELKYGKTAEMWKKMFLFVCCPLIALATVNMMLIEEPERPEFKPYEHLRIRRKNFPWRDGVKSLLHNPHTNALPTGYETGHH